MHGYRTWLALVAVLAAGSASAQGQPTPGSSSQVDSFYGAFGTVAPIAVPAFRGLEPSLKLSYSSASFSGQAGMGWGLSGFSSVERAGAGKGSPRYDGSDLFLLDGQELIPCASGSSSPSCTAGGTHSTRIENYHRIRHDSAANTWTVWRKDGTRQVYSPVFQAFRWGAFVGTFRWGLTSVVDTSGNTVSYGWWCDGSPTVDCYPDTVSYNGYTVRLYREARPDPITFANGSTTLGRTSFRLRSILVSAPGPTPIRAYRLTYTSSATTQRSLLASIQQFGRDVVMDAAGNITGGSALPALSLGWQQEGQSFSAATINWGNNPYIGNVGVWTRFGDYNGDGRTDLLQQHGYNTYVQLSTGSSLSASVNWAYNPYRGDHHWTHFGDYNGDGRTDMLQQYAYNTYVFLSTGSGFAAPVNWAYNAYQGNVGSWTRMGDFNGDGRTDMLQQHGYNTYVFLSTGSGFAAPVNWAYNAYRGDPQWTHLHDFNGDGRTDMLQQYANDNYVFLSTGSGFSGPVNWVNNPYRGDAHWTRFGDFNGDGRTDLLQQYYNDNYVYLSTGTGFASPVNWGNNPYRSDAQWSRFADFNGDGRTDLLQQYYNANYVYLSTGTGFAPVVNWGNNPYRGDAQWTNFIDFSGDGKLDMLQQYGQANYVYTASPGSLLLTSVGNGLGGTTAIGYTPSSAWSNTYLPGGMVLQTVSSVQSCDGRGSCSTTRYNYQGGLWSSSERRFLGFRRVTAVLDAAGNYTETYYHQHVGCISKPEITYYRDAAGNIYSYTSYTYSENSAPPFTSLLTQRWDYECNLGASCRRVLTQIGYDQYGNATTTQEYGDFDLAGDERTTLRGYVPNTSAYVVAHKAYENVYAGIGTGGALLQQTLYAYDGATSYTTAPTLGRLTQVQAWNSLTGGYLTTRHTYDAWGNQTSTLNPLGITTTSTTYDATFRTFPVRECDALGRCVSRAWDTALGLETSNTDPNGHTALTAYDAFGRPLSESKAGRQVQYSYLAWGDPHNQRIRQTLVDGSPDGLWTETYHDGLGRLWRTVKEGGATRDTLYSDGSTRPWRRSAWYGPGETPRYQVFAYDGTGRVRSVTNPDGTQALTSYGVGFIVSLNELGHEKVTWTNPWGHTTQIREKNGSTYAHTTFTLDPLGRVVRVTDAAGNPFTYSYNSLGWKVSECDPDVGCLSYTYDGAGNLLTQRNARGELTTYTYDAGGRRLTRTRPDGSRIQWLYDEPGRGASLGRLTSVVDPSSSESLTYDALGRAVSATKCVLGTCYSLQQAYDLLDRVTSLTYPDGEVVTYGYDSAGRLASVSGYVQSMAYNASGQLLSARYANGTTATYTYDANRQWLSASQVTGPSGTLYQASYAYDAAARVTGMSSTTNPLLNLAFGYDELSRLTSVSGAQSQSLGYDAVGNLTWNSQVGSYAYTASQRHAVSAAGGQSYTYDAAGNMLSGRGRTYTWDFDNRLTAVSNASGTTRFAYDYSGQRVYKTGPSGTHAYFGAFVEVRNGALVKNYYAGPNRVASRDSSGPRWFHADHLGSVRLATSASGAVLERYDYSALGATVQAVGSSSSPRGFGGHFTDPETGLVYMNARYYDPALGRFLSADSLVPDASNPQAFNRYAFAYNNPISNTDPTGHAPVVAAVVAVATAFSSGSALSFVALVGAATTVAGYVLEDPLLSTIGSVLLGFTGGGYLGAAVAAATSPLSPLDPKLKQAIGWAFTAYGLIDDLKGMLPGEKAASSSWQCSADCITNETGNVRIRINGGSAEVQVTGIFTGKPGTPLWDRITRDVQDFFANMRGELGPTGTFVKEQLARYNIASENVRYLGHSMGAWTGWTLGRNGVVGNVVGMAMPLPALAQISERPVQGFNLTVVLGAGDPVSGMLGGSGAGALAARSIGAAVRVVDTGRFSIAAHDFMKFCGSFDASPCW